jgi:hypothetical protein
MKTNVTKTKYEQFPFKCGICNDVVSNVRAFDESGTLNILILFELERSRESVLT